MSLNEREWGTKYKIIFPMSQSVCNMMNVTEKDYSCKPEILAVLDA